MPQDGRVQADGIAGIVCGRRGRRNRGLRGPNVEGERRGKYILYQKIKRIRLGLGSRKRKVSLIKNNVARDDDLASRKIKTPVALLGRRVTEKNTRCGARRQFMGSRGTKVRIAQATENSEDGVIWHFAVKEMIGNIIMYGR
jgi:hypothetical protein